MKLKRKPINTKTSTEKLNRNENEIFFMNEKWTETKALLFWLEWKLILTQFLKRKYHCELCIEFDSVTLIEIMFAANKL